MKILTSKKPSKRPFLTENFQKFFAERPMFWKPKFYFDQKSRLSVEKRSSLCGHVSKTDFGARKTAIFSILDQKTWVCTHDFFKNFDDKNWPIFQGVDSHFLNQKKAKIEIFEKVSLAQFSMFLSNSASKEPYEPYFGASAKKSVFWPCFEIFCKGSIRKS